MKLISLEVGNTQDQRGSAYVKVYREWDKNEAERTKAISPEYNQTQDQTSFILQQWQQESMLNQLDKNIKAVKKRANLANDKRVSKRSDTKFSLGLIDPQTKHG